MSLKSMPGLFKPNAWWATTTTQLVEPPEANLSRGMRQVHGRYTQQIFNRVVCAQLSEDTRHAILITKCTETNKQSFVTKLKPNDDFNRPFFRYAAGIAQL